MCCTGHPDLKLLYAEAQIGWIPYLLERIDDVWRHPPRVERLADALP